MGVVDFSRFSNTDFNTTPFQYVIFGANGGLLEVELNEAQYLGFKRDYLALKSIGNVSIGATVSRDTNSGVTTFTGDFVIDGYAVCLNDCVINTNVGDTIYAKVSLETLTKDSTVKKNGYVNGETLSNTIIDNRFGIETSRRKAIKLELSTTHISGSIPIAFVNNSGVAEFSIINSSLSDMLNRIKGDIDGINSKLSGQLGSHTVKSDVPENAVFTDTVYDYSALLGYDIYNLVSLKDATYPANKTWLSKDFIAPFDGFVFFMVQTDATSGAFTQVFKEDGVLISNNQQQIADFNTWGCAYSYQIFKGKTYHFYSYNNTATAFNKVMLCISKKLEPPTEYVPYAPSNVALAEENSQQSTEMMDIKMLGWSVPKECPIQNEVNGNQFVQKVGRVDLGKYDYVYQSSFPRFYTIKHIPNSILKDEWNTNIYSEGYLVHAVDNNSIDKSICMYGGLTYFKDTRYTDETSFKTAMQGQYLYYELATYNTMTIDGNEIGETVSDVRKETTVNLLKATLGTVTQNGVTCTNNGDGTYTVNGTASSQVILNITQEVENKFIGNKLLGCPSGGSGKTYSLLISYFTENNGWLNENYDLGNGTIINNSPKISISILIRSGTVCNNLVFKPMLTTNLSATYDDFVPYTGDTGKLNSDVADIKNDLDKQVDEINQMSETIEELNNKVDNKQDLLVDTNTGVKVNLTLEDGLICVREA